MELTDGRRGRAGGDPYRPLGTKGNIKLQTFYRCADRVVFLQYVVKELCRLIKLTDSDDRGEVRQKLGLPHRPRQPVRPRELKHIPYKMRA